jgi:hypothetical protein
VATVAKAAAGIAHMGLTLRLRSGQARKPGSINKRCVLCAFGVEIFTTEARRTQRKIYKK